MYIASKIIKTFRARKVAKGYPQFGRHNAPDWKSACQLLSYIAEQYADSSGKKTLILGSGEAASALSRTLDSSKINHDIIEFNHKGDLSQVAYEKYCCILLAERKSSATYAIARYLLDIPEALSVPLEYVAIPLEENRQLKFLDDYNDGDFVSTLHIRHGDALTEIYLDSLNHFERKTDIRDYLDICQIIDEISRRHVEGNVAEFGSYKGHSGYLISRFLSKIGSKKILYMFDMFERFPEETIGVDRFWSNTHHVKFSEVSERFFSIENVKLIKGDFTKTLSQTDTGKLSFAFIDCDSYRGTKYLLEEIWDENLSIGGIVALEDYGHAALLGNRLAAHEFFDDRNDAHIFFSQFSGFYLAVKIFEKNEGHE